MSGMACCPVTQLPYVTVPSELGSFAAPNLLYIGKVDKVGLSLGAKKARVVIVSYQKLIVADKNGPIKRVVAMGSIAKVYWKRVRTSKACETRQVLLIVEEQKDMLVVCTQGDESAAHFIETVTAIREGQHRKSFGAAGWNGCEELPSGVSILGKASDPYKGTSRASPLTDRKPGKHLSPCPSPCTDAVSISTRSPTGLTDQDEDISDASSLRTVQTDPLDDGLYPAPAPEEAAEVGPRVTLHTRGQHWCHVAEEVVHPSGLDLEPEPKQGQEGIVGTQAWGIAQGRLEETEASKRALLIASEVAARTEWLPVGCRQRGGVPVASSGDFEGQLRLLGLTPPQRAFLTNTLCIRQASHLSSVTVGELLANLPLDSVRLVLGAFGHREGRTHNHLCVALGPNPNIPR